LGFEVHGLAAVSLDGQVVSSTRIREAVRTGDFDAASQMLGRPYAICGQVVAGDRLGRQMGFPTANLDVTLLNLPPNGVYAGATHVAGQFYRVALNIGLRPTLGSPKPQLRAEAHLLDFEGELYGSQLEIEPGTKLRDERKFASLDELRRQIELDVAEVKSLI
jgi:riboflavin kinase/FMN adenylyltransferase